MKSMEEFDIIMSSNRVVFQYDDLKTEGCRNSKLYFETKSPTNVTCIMKKKDPDDASLTNCIDL